jgi:hypothetical protein
MAPLGAPTNGDRVTVNAGGGEPAALQWGIGLDQLSLLSINQGHLLKSQLDANGHSLLVEAKAGGSSGVCHNFWVELFYTTPTRSFNARLIVTYYLIDPA